MERLKELAGVYLDGCMTWEEFRDHVVLHIHDNMTEEEMPKLATAFDSVPPDA